MIRTHSTRLVLAAVVMTLAAPAAQAQFGLVSESQELQAGRQADAQLRQKYRVSSDPAMNRIVQTLGNHLAAVSERPNIPWTFRVLDSNELNAFSVPGYVYMTTATIQAARGDRDMIAGVFAHEIGHTTGKHAVKQMEKGTLGNLLLGTLLGKSSGTIKALGGLAANLVMLGYSRGDENDADKRAVNYMLRAGYDPNGLIRFFDMLNQKGGSSAGGVLTYFRTHPPTGDRISRVKQEIAKQGGSTSNGMAYRRFPEEEDSDAIRQRQLREQRLRQQRLREERLREQRLRERYRDPYYDPFR